MSIRLLRSFFCISSLLLATGARADIDCPAAAVVYVQVHSDVVYVLLEGQGWHLVGLHTQMGTKEKYAALLAAQMAGKRIVMRYPDGYNCAANDYNTQSVMVRTLD